MVRWMYALLFACCVQTASAAVLKASIDKNPAMQGEIILLQIQYDAKVAGDSLDFSALTQDFRVDGPSVQQSMQIFNGQSSQTTVWSLYLVPKATGKFTIPAFRIGNDQSQPIALEVIPATTNQGSSAAKVFVEARLEPTSLYVQQVGYYSVKVYLKGELQNGALSAPTVDGAQLTAIGSDVEGSEIVNGERFRTFTRRYTVVPQRSGDLVIPATSFNGEMRDEDEGFSARYVPARMMSAQSEPITLNVKPIPDGQPQPWLVSSLVTLTEEWSGDTDKLVQGEPITRTITLTAVDLYDNQLPDVPLTNPSGVKQYPEKPKGHTVERKQRIVAQKQLSVAVIAETDGEIQMPEIRIPWWNSVSNQAEVAVLPAKTLQVQLNPTQQAAVETPIPSALTPTTAPQGWWLETWQISYSAVVLFVLLLASWFYLLSVRLSQHKEPQETVAAPDVRFNENRFKLACQTNDAQTCQVMLLRWARQYVRSDIQDLSQLDALLAEGAFKQQLSLLRFGHYQRIQQPWQGDALYTAWKHHPAITQQPTQAVLPSLYPSPE